MIGLETIEERRERLLSEHARANAAKIRAEHWKRKAEGAIPARALTGE
jgi:hypothetical protein